MIKNLLKKIQKRFNLVRPQKIVDVLFKSYVLLVIVPVLLLGCIFTSMYSKRILEYSKSKSVMLMKSSVDIMNEKVDSIYNITYNLATNKSFLNYNKYDPMSAERSIALSDIRTNIEYFLEQTDIANDICVYYREGDIVVGREKERKVREKLKRVFGAEISELNEFLYNENGNFIRTNGVNADNEPEDYIIYVKAIDNWLRPGDIYAIYFLDENSIENVIEMVNVDDAGSVLLFNNENECLYASGNEKSIYKIIEKTQSAPNDGSYEYQSIRQNGEKRLVLTGNIGTSELRVYYVVDNSFFVRQTWYIWIVIFLVCAFIILIGMTIAKIYTKRIYNPIMNIIEFFRPDNPKLSPGQKFVESKFVEIQQLQEKITTYNEAYLDSVKEKQISYFVKNYITYSDDLKQQMEAMNIPTDNNYFTVILIKIDHLEEIEKNIKAQHYRDFIKEKFVQEFEGCSQGEYKELLGFYDDEYIGMLICSDEKVYFENNLKYVQEQIYKNLDMTISVYFTHKAEVWQDIPNAYAKLRSIANQMKLRGNGLLLNCDNRSEKKKYIDFRLYSEKIVSLIKENKYDEIDTLIDDLFIDKNLLFNETVYIFNSFIIVIMGIIKECGNSESFSVSNPYKSIDDFTSITEIAQYMKGLCRKVGENISDKTLSRDDAMYSKMLGYISENYTRQITQREAAETFGFSVGYFSRYFKSIVGKSFIDTLNCYRIDKAKEMIQNDKGIKIFEIAEKVGFVSYKTFSDAFKRYEGKSPEKYKRSIM